MKLPDYDVVIVGAGISGIGNAYWLRKKCPDKKIVVLEARDAIGGTWSLFRYPGVRSDSDMFTFGYRFKPWTNPQSLSSGESIRAYLEETIDENKLSDYIHFRHKMIHSNWSSDGQCWTLDVETKDGIKQISTRFLSICTGYYNYKEAYRPDFKNEASFKGKIVQPQFWPKDLDYKDMNIAVIGSGATAVTIVPSMASSGAKHVTMIQRSPTYVVSLPNRTTTYVFLQKIMPLKWAYRITRIQNILVQIISYTLSKLFPNFMKNFFMKMVRKELAENYPVDKHFNPSYYPWDQRLCVVPDGDLFQSIKNEQASIVTGEIQEFSEDGIKMSDGEVISADIIVLATGLNIQLLGGASIAVDGKTYDASKEKVYKGMMLSGLPNLMYSFGYTNASWTLKVDLTANYLCKLVKYMDRNNLKSVMPITPQNVKEEEFLNLNSGYIKRAQAILPKNGAKKPWRVYQNYIMDMLNIRYSSIRNKHLEFK